MLPPTLPLQLERCRDRPPVAFPQGTDWARATEYLPERQAMMQAWADMLDDMQRGAQVIPFQRTANA